LASVLQAAEQRLEPRRTGEPRSPVTADEMVRVFGEVAPAEVHHRTCILPDYLPVRVPVPHPTVISTIGDYGLVGSTLTSCAEYLHPPKGDPPGVEEVIFWARKWEVRQWLLRDPRDYQGVTVWLKMWGLPGILLS
jgi:hypothetical protein